MMSVLHDILSPRSLVVLVALVCLGCGSSDNKQQSASLAEAGESKVDSRDSLTVELLGADSVTVLDLLLAEHEVDYVASGAGAFVRSIGQITGGSGHFWVYSVNDSMAQVAADKYYTSDGDRIIWHFRRVGE